MNCHKLLYSNPRSQNQPQSPQLKLTAIYSSDPDFASLACMTTQSDASNSIQTAFKQTGFDNY